jgi:hypothetical protein
MGHQFAHTFSNSRLTEEIHTLTFKHFTKWVEAEALAPILSKVIQNFIWRNIIYRFSLPDVIIFDTDTQFASQSTVEFRSKLRN